MKTRFAPIAAAALSVVLTTQPGVAAEARKTGDWTFTSNAVSRSGDRVLNACSSTTESGEGTRLTLRLEPVPDEIFDARLAFRNAAWNIAVAPGYVRVDVGGRSWIMPAEGGDNEVVVAWRGEPYLLPFLEDLASRREAVLRTGDGSVIARFSLSGSRDAIEAMKSCLEAQIVGTLDATFDAMSDRSTENPF